MTLGIVLERLTRLFRGAQTRSGGTGGRTGLLEGFAELRAYAYFFEPCPAAAMAEVIKARLGFVPRDLPSALAGLPSLSYCVIGGDERKFAIVHRVHDVLVLVLGFNESPQAVGWSTTQPMPRAPGSVTQCRQMARWRRLAVNGLRQIPIIRHFVTKRTPGDGLLGEAVLYQCDWSGQALEEVGEDDARVEVEAAFRASPGLKHVLATKVDRVPFGLLFNCSGPALCWLLVNSPGCQNAERWRATDWIRFVLFSKKYEFYRHRLAREVSRFQPIVKGIENRSFDPSDSRGELEQSGHELRKMANNLSIALLGYRHTLGDTFHPAAPPAHSHLSARLRDMESGERAVKDELAALVARAPSLLGATPAVPPKGNTRWHYGEDGTLPRFVNASCGAIKTAYARICRKRNAGLKADDDTLSVARDIYEWLLHREPRVIYDYEEEEKEEEKVGALSEQVILTHAKALDKGTCIDLACLYAALLLAAGRRPVLLHLFRHGSDQTHMVCGFWLKSPEKYFYKVDKLLIYTPFLDDAVKQVESEHLRLVECMGFATGKKTQHTALDLGFDEAMGIAERDVVSPVPTWVVNYAIDVAYAQEKFGQSPHPQG